MTTMKRCAAVIVAGLLAAGTPSAQDLERLFKAAVNTETVDRNCKGAIEQYKTVAAGPNRPLAAQALLRMAECYRALGDDAQAERTYKRIVDDFGDQRDQASAARERLAEVQARATPVGRSIEPRVLCEQCGGVGSVSRDGRWFVVSNTNSGGDIQRRNLTNNTVERMRAKAAAGSPSQGGSQAYWPILSADSRQIAYAFNRGSLPQDPTLAHARLMVMPNQPGAAGRVLVDNPELVFPVPVGWRGNDAVLTLAMKPDLTWQLMWVDAKNGTTTVLKSLDWRVDELARAVSVSPDGRYIVYSALVNNPPAAGARPATPDQQLYVLAADGRSETTLINGAGVYRHPVWTPGGTHVVYVSDVSGTSDLWAIAVREGRAAGQPKLLQKDIGDVVSLGITDAGVYHYFSLRSGVRRASIMRLGTIARANAPPSSSDSPGSVETFVGQGARWSPDGRSMALIRPRPRTEGVFDVVVKDLVTGVERIYRDEHVVAQRPLWFPDGRSLLLLTAKGEERWWARMDVASGQFTSLLNQTEAQKAWPGFLIRQSAVLSSDSRTVYFAASSSTTKTTIGRIDRIVALNLEDGTLRNLTLRGDDGSLPFVTQGVAIALSPDGQTLAVAFRGSKSGSTRLATMDLDGGNYRELTAAFTNDTLTDTLAWSRDGQSIFLVDRAEPGGDRLMRVSKDGGTPVFTGVRVAGLRNFDVSPDGTRLVYGTSHPEGAGMLHATLDVKAVLASRP